MGLFVSRVAAGERNFSPAELQGALNEAGNAFKGNNVQLGTNILQAIAIVSIAKNVKLEQIIAKYANENQVLLGRVQQYENNNNISPELVAKLEKEMKELQNDRARYEERIRVLELNESMAAISKLRHEAMVTQLANVGKWGGTTLGTGGGLMAASPAAGPAAPVVFLAGLGVLIAGSIFGPPNLEDERTARIAKIDLLETKVRQGRSFAAAKIEVGL